MKKDEFERVARALTDEGKLIEAGFLALRMTAIPPGAPQVQVEEMRKAFFCGAQHVFASIMGLLEPGAEATDNDLRRLTLINEELEEFVLQLKSSGRVSQ